MKLENKRAIGDGSVTKGFFLMVCAVPLFTEILLFNTLLCDSSWKRFLVVFRKL